MCEPMSRSGNGRSHKYRRIDIEQDVNEMKVKAEIFLGQDIVDIKLLLNTGAQRSFIIKSVYEAKMKGHARKQKCYMHM